MNTKPWSIKELYKMLFHNYVGTIADNIIEIGWVLCFTLLPNKAFVEKATSMMGANDAYWVVLSSLYYAVRTSMTSIIPKHIVNGDLNTERKYVKNATYLVYLLLTPCIILSIVFVNNILSFIGVLPPDYALYKPYFLASFISILIAAPWSVLIPSLMRIKGETKIASILDHFIAWSMIIGIFITTHGFHKGVLWAMIVNIGANISPLLWFVWKKPLGKFWTNGLEVDKQIITEYWSLTKTELIRRWAPRLSAFFGVSIMATTNPIILAVKYWMSSIGAIFEGWVDASAGLMNINSSRNIGLGLKGKDVHNNNSKISNKSIKGLIISELVTYIIVYVLGIHVLPTSIYKPLINPVIWILIFIEMASKIRYYAILSVGRTQYTHINKPMQYIYAGVTAVLTPILLLLFVKTIPLNIVGVFLTGAIVGLLQWLLTEIYFKRKIGYYL